LDVTIIVEHRNTPLVEQHDSIEKCTQDYKDIYFNLIIEMENHTVVNSADQLQSATNPVMQLRKLALSI
jgi:glutathione synthase/RimK-type ligase-like ATP-grasp enzyme